MCLLPDVDAQWSYVMSVAQPENNASACFAELLQPEVESQSWSQAWQPWGGDPIERVSLPINLARAAHKAVMTNDKEVLLLRWSVGGMESVPMRIAIYESHSTNGRIPLPVVV